LNTKIALVANYASILQKMRLELQVICVTREVCPDVVPMQDLKIGGFITIG
jgi:hypothetical protein